MLATDRSATFKKPMQARHKKNFKQLIKDIKNTPKEAFNMGTWGDVSQKAFCGTVACALGRAAMQPWANDQGVEMWHIWQGTSTGGLNNPDNWYSEFYIDGKEASPEKVAKRLFGFDLSKNFEFNRDFVYIFLVCERTKKQQLRAMREWLAKQEAE